MAPVLLSLLFLALMAVSPGAAKKKDSSSDVSELIAKANAGKRFLVHSDIIPNRNRNADPCVRKGCLWRKYRRYVYVPVTISRVFNRQERNMIIRSLLTFHRSTCIRFIWRYWWHRNYIYFFSGAGCYSYVGRQRRGQPISLKRRGCLYTSTIQHEVLHALAFHHEHVRSDRDKYVTILDKNIQTGKASNFRIVNTNNLGTPYDFSSVMHYSSYAFSKNGEPTIVVKGDPEKRLGKAKSMSANDIARVNKLYSC